MYIEKYFFDVHTNRPKIWRGGLESCSSSSRYPPYIYINMSPPIKVQSCVQNFLGKFPKVGIAPKKQLKNFQKKLDTLDFTYYQMVFIL